jgi:hypothetical protein
MNKHYLRTNKDTIVISGGFIKIARIREEWCQDVENPAEIIDSLIQDRACVDIFTFWQRLPETKPKYDYYVEWDSIAALPITNYSHWWGKQIDPKTRNMIRKAEKKGLSVRIAQFDDEFVKGMEEIFNESPIRQGRPFWHYGKSAEMIRNEFAKDVHNEELIGAYYKNKLIGFVMLVHAGKYGILGQIISKVEHRDKAPNNALLAKTVEICEQKKYEYLVYAKWASGTLSDFKRSNGFAKVDLPRYYIPITMKGRIALKLKLHHEIGSVLPERLKNSLIYLRKKWYLSK